MARELGTLSPTETSSPGSLPQHLSLSALLIKLQCLGPSDHAVGVTLRTLKVLQEAFFYLPKTRQLTQASPQESRAIPRCLSWRFQTPRITGCILNMN